MLQTGSLGALNPTRFSAIYGLVFLVLLAVWLIGGVLALRREVDAGRPIAGWLIAFLVAGPLAVLVYGATQL